MWDCHRKHRLLLLKIHEDGAHRCIAYGVAAIHTRKRSAGKVYCCNAHYTTRGSTRKVNEKEITLDNDWIAVT